MARTSVKLSDADFLKAFFATQSAGLTFQELSKETKLAPLSLYQRYVKMAKTLEAEGVTLPKMPLKPKKIVSVKDLVAVAVAHGVAVNTKEKTENSHKEMLENAKSEQTYVDA